MSSVRLVSLLSSATEILYGLGLGDRVLAVSHECDWPPEASTKPRATRSAIDSSQSSEEIDNQVKRLLRSGEPLYLLDGELIASLRPNLIVTQAQCDVCAVRLDDVRSIVQSRPELAHTQILSLQPNRLDDIFRDIEHIGQATGRTWQARDFIAALRKRVEAVRRTAVERIAAFGRAKRVALFEWTHPIMLAANWTPELVSIAGGECPLTVAGEHSRYQTWEEIRQLDPEVIVVAPCGFGVERAVVESEALKQLPGWHETAAAKAGQVFAMDGNAYLNRSGPRIVDTLEILADLYWNDGRESCDRRIAQRI